MTVISADVFRLGAVKLTGTPPAVPASPAFVLARLSGESLNYQPQTATSTELDASGQVRDSVLTGARTTGNVELPVSKHTYFEDAMAAGFRNTWGTGQKGDGATVPTFSALTADELIVGSALQLFMLEKRFVNPAGGFIYHRVNDAAVASMSINVQPGQEVTSSIAYSGGTLDLVETALAGSTYADPGIKPTFTSPDVSEITIAGVTGALCFSNLSMEFNSNVRGIECIGTLGFKEQVLGRFEATITGTAYFASNDLLDYLVAQTEFACTVQLEDALGDYYEFFYPRCKMTSGSANAGGTGQDVLVNVGIQALYNPNWGYTCKVTRFAAP